jgi:hypothetical protein
VLSDLGLRAEDDDRARLAVEGAVASLGARKSASVDEFCELMRKQARDLT